ncbi:MAG: glucose 1-dehydrogenase [Proteobacteria bacterium]|nr:glucose 1-dehydrogenase [Pseudomonadota bacterium]
MGRLDTKTALITGAATGIGLATARRFIEEGATVILTDRSVTDGEAAAADLGPDAFFLEQDVTQEDHWQMVMTQISEQHGRLDILVNNAGILGTGANQTIEDMEIAEWRAIASVNVEGVLFGCQHAVRAMKENGGSIVNISSVAAIIGTPHLVAYGASKAAVRQLTKSVAMHATNNGYNIRCNSVHPDPVRTNMGDALMSMYGGDIQEGWDRIPGRIPIGTAAEPVDIANGILFLASDESRHMTGSELVIDGGLTAI